MCDSVCVISCLRYLVCGSECGVCVGMCTPLRDYLFGVFFFFAASPASFASEALSLVLFNNGLAVVLWPACAGVHAGGDQQILVPNL